MAQLKRKRPKLGDVLEIPTTKGFAYLQYVNRHPVYGALIRVLPGLYVKRPERFSDLVRQPERFFTFFPVGAAVNQGIVIIVANESIPGAAQKIPIMRVEGGIDKGGRVLNWWIIDSEGDRKWMVSELSQEQKNLPIAGIMNDTLLVQRIVEGWSPSDRV